MANTLITAAYDPQDDKIRISASQRLDAETYTQVKAAGYGWAPKQGVFYAVWSPSREDLALELAGEIGDEDTTLVDRAEQRAERFEGYQENRTRDAHQAYAAVDRIADGIPLGQPILVGHHSERHARRDAEKIENGMRRAVKMWDTAQYWQSRAAGALRAAKYKELPAVRARRIKGIEAEIRSMVADYTPHANQPAIMQTPWDWSPSSRDLTIEQRVAEQDAARVPHVWVGPKGRGGRWVAADRLEKIKAGHARSIAHCEMRLLYERAMLAEGGGLIADKFDIAVGGRVLRRYGEWFVVTGLNRREGRLMSVSVIGHFAGTIPIEEVKDYRAPAEGDADKVAAVKKLPPICNYPGEGFLHLTKSEYAANPCLKWSDFPKFERISRTDTVASHRVRRVRAPGKEYYHTVGVFLTDQKRVDPPARAAEFGPVKFEKPPIEQSDTQTQFTRATPDEMTTAMDGLKETLKAGVQVVSAPQLFPTPRDLAARMVDMACLADGATVLEPSAGTGVICDAVGAAAKLTAVEINHNLAAELRRNPKYSGVEVVEGDFLEQNGNLGKFDAVLANPPFAPNAADIKHILHMRNFVKPNGCIVAICANGPRQNEQLKPLCEVWEPLPAGTFSEAGTNVSTVLLRIRAGGGKCVT